jgi:long-chain acyl-CoA synthetase
LQHGELFCSACLFSATLRLYPYQDNFRLIRLTGAPRTANQEKSMDVTAVLRRTAQIRANDVATVFGARTQTWRQFQERVQRLAGALQNLGVVKGDRVATLMQNSDRYFEILFATPWAGGIAVPLNARWSVPELADAITDSGIKILIIDDANLPAGQALAQGAPSLRTIFAGEGTCPASSIAYEQLVASTTPTACQEPGRDAVFAIFYTGGTTGRSKGVMVSHGNILASTLASLAEGMFREDTVYLNAMPTFHLSSAWPIVATAMTGAKSIIQPTVDPTAMLKAMDRERITEIFLVPTTLQMLLEHPIFNTCDTRSLRQVIYGASPITETLLDRAIAAFPQTAFIQVYGMTELSPLATALPSINLLAEGRRKGRHRSAGRAVYGVEIEIVDDQAQPVPAGTVGEIRIRGNNVMLGYWNRPEETEKVLRDGWLYSGDGAYMDEDGFIYIVDRIKDMIISGGENIYSAEVENVISQHMAVQQCAVIGVPHDKWGEQVHAFIIPHPDTEVTADDIINFCRDRIAHYKCPRSVTIRQDPFPLSPVGKILKHELRRLYRP